ncbi:hypothetical protein HBZS_104180 [Helicobacter bizzozeronii CCUG 35545]|nr:hypothetical protein HBZS_104180 [Helicobacter bizzozeronii CCUG 35545]
MPSCQIIDVDLGLSLLKKKKKQVNNGIYGMLCGHGRSFEYL